MWDHSAMTDMPPGTYVATRAERLTMLAAHKVAGRPVGPTSGWGMQHLFRRPGEWSLCDEAVWTSCVRGDFVSELTWICSRCQAEAVVACIEHGECPICGGWLTEPERSPGGWRHCRGCRRGWLVRAQAGGDQVLGQNWPERVWGAA